MPHRSLQGAQVFAAMFTQCTPIVPDRRLFWAIVMTSNAWACRVRQEAEILKTADTWETLLVHTANAKQATKSKRKRAKFMHKW